MSLVIEATAQSPERRANSTASALRNGRRTRRAVSSLGILDVIPARPGRAMIRRAGRCPELLRGRLVAGLHGNIDAPVALGGELDVAFRLGEQGVVGSHADVGARMPLGAALAHQDVSGQHALAAVALHAEP